MYADNMTDSMAAAIAETARRREIQIAYNTEHGIDPAPLRKKIGDITEMLAREEEDTKTVVADSGAITAEVSAAGRPVTELRDLIESLTEQMRAAAVQLQFEVAARIRDEIGELKRELREMESVE